MPLVLLCRKTSTNRPGSVRAPSSAPSPRSPRRASRSRAGEPGACLSVSAGRHISLRLEGVCRQPLCSRWLGRPVRKTSQRRTPANVTRASIPSIVLQVVFARCGVGYATDERPDHRTGGHVQEHSSRVAAGGRERDHGDRKHHEEAAQRSARIPCRRPARNSDHEADEKSRAVESPHRDRPLDVEDVELLVNRPVHEPGEPAEDQAEERAEEGIGDPHRVLVALSGADQQAGRCGQARPHA